MLSFALRRIGVGLVLTLVMTFITFWLLSFSFESIVSSRLGQAATPESIAAVKVQLGFDRPLMVQYGEWLWNVLHGDFGVSLFTQEPVSGAVFARLGVTLSVVLPALIISTLSAVVLGVFAASRAGAADKITQGIMLVGHFVPGLLVAIALVVVFAVNLGWLPATGFTPFSEDPGLWLASVVIPVTVLSIGGAANIASQVRGSMIDELRKDYVRTLRTRGIPTNSIILRHALRNSAGPALTVFSLEFLAMFGSALIIEQVFALPGFGTFSFNSALIGDIPVIMGLAVFGTLMTITVNLLADLGIGWLNPKARVY
ncbi:ABC transporter permease [Arthrobacter sp. B2a2-09]|uniref:ABC transporter permease n=1 Tax=Arthrobacter sp. B2a2-09 TaxID=2952822 RepID=UPI0022CD7159|nr:ABC transporter permease [Arthrobacter sp. B2a2-09]MCZ9880614.1 ABC transporter permease [Arthrobacter sp. B2a2-09]